MTTNEHLLNTEPDFFELEYMQLHETLLSAISYHLSALGIPSTEMTISLDYDGLSPRLAPDSLKFSLDWCIPATLLRPESADLIKRLITDHGYQLIAASTVASSHHDFRCCEVCGCIIDPWAATEDGCPDCPYLDEISTKPCPALLYICLRN